MKFFTNFPDRKHVFENMSYWIKRKKRGNFLLYLGKKNIIFRNGGRCKKYHILGKYSPLPKFSRSVLRVSFLFVNSSSGLRQVFLRGPTIDKVYLDEPCGSKTVAGVLLARLKRVGYVTHFYKDTIPERDPLSVQLNFPIPMFAVRMGPGVS